MKREIETNFNGIVNIKDRENVHKAFFHVDNDLITVIPCDSESPKADYASTKEKKDGWLYGVAEDGCNVAFYHPKNFSVRVSAPRKLRTAKFHSPILLKSTSGSEQDLRSFDAIEFYGGIIDVLYGTDKIIDRCHHSEKCIKFCDQDSYTKNFDVNIGEMKFKITYTISKDDLSNDLGKVPDLRNGIHSVLRFDFSEAQPIQKFLTYYNYALNFLQFCAGRLNVGFKVKLHRKNSRDIVLTRIREIFDDYAEDYLDITQVIRFDFLNDKFPKLFKLINEDTTRPYLHFLKKRNKHIGYILYNDIPDICVALEREFEFCNKAKSHREHSRIYLKEKINTLIDEFFEPMKSIFEKSLCIEHVKYEITKSYTIDEMKNMIIQFIKMRNLVSHAEIVWNEGRDIFPHLQLLVYFSVLKRSGYTIDESKCILSYMFNGKF